MANSIALPAGFVDVLDELYMQESITADLTSNESLFRAGGNTKEIQYKQITTDGLGDYTRETGSLAGSYAAGSTTLSWKTATMNYDRARTFSVDTQDDVESYGNLFVELTADFEKTKVVPEADAFTFATLAAKAGLKIGTPASFANASEFLAALLVAKDAMDEAGVPLTDRYLYATSALLNSVMGLDTTKSREILGYFAAVKPVPQNRFYTAINLLDGKTSGEEAGSYVKGTGAADINFMVIHKPAIIKFDKHVVGDIIPPELNPFSDAAILKYRKYGIVDVYNNKVNGIYLHNKAVV